MKYNYPVQIGKLIIIQCYVLKIQVMIKLTNEYDKEVQNL